MRYSRLLKLGIACFAVFLFSSGESLAKTDLAIFASDISFSSESPLEGEKVRIFARVFNLGDTDVYGYVVFGANNVSIGDPQPISVRPNTYDDTFIDWPPKAGTYEVEAKIVNTSLPDENSENNKVSKGNYFIDSDTDGDKIGNGKDLDDDDDGLSDEKETSLGTNSLVWDTDKDGAKDGIDPFPLDSKEWQDSDRDALGDNADTDDDNDGLTDEEEVFSLGTNPLDPDNPAKVQGAAIERVQTLIEEKDWFGLFREFWWVLALISSLYFIRRKLVGD